MTRKFIDTNIFLEIFTRSGEKSDKSKKLVGADESICTSMLVASEVEWVLRSFYKMEKRLVVKCLRAILSSNTKIDNKKLLINALGFYEENNVDWTDCLNMFLVKEKNIDKVYSYDNRLNKFNWISRLEP